MLPKAEDRYDEAVTLKIVKNIRPKRTRIMKKCKQKKYNKKNRKQFSNRSQTNTIKQLRKREYQTIQFADHTKSVEKGWVYETDFSYARSGLIRIVTIVASVLILSSFLLALYLIVTFESFIPILIILVITVVFLVELIKKPHTILRSVKWIDQGNIQIQEGQVDLTLGDQLHIISLADVKRYQCHQFIGIRPYAKVVKIIVKMKDSSEFYFYQSTKLDANVDALFDIGHVIVSALPNIFEKVIRGAWLHTKKTTYYANVLTVLLFISLAICYKIYDEVGIAFALLPIAIMPRLMLFVLKSENKLNTDIIYTNKEE